jgi:2-polyprenyl-3-methyl-5-hydroxy-6-metoxy-1,4-benzoquinol methylase
VSRISFENYGRRARKLADATLATARYTIQKAAQKRIVADVAAKLDLQPEDRLLEIGCGIGMLLVPLSFLVEQATGIDHRSCVQRLQRSFCGENLRLVAGNFLDAKVRVQERGALGFDKILCYSVLHYLSDEDEVFAVLDRALGLLEPGGRVLLGDLPNESLKERFLSSPAGRAFTKSWKKAQAKERAENGPELGLPEDPRLVHFDDALVLKICADCRRRGFDAYILPQQGDLPFGHTREDLLIVRPA